MKIYLITIHDAHLGNVRKWAASMVEAKRIAKAARDEYDLLSRNSIDIQQMQFSTKKADVITWLNLYAGFNND